jgi:hypothetical protein
VIVVVVGICEVISRKGAKLKNKSQDEIKIFASLLSLRLCVKYS